MNGPALKVVPQVNLDEFERRLRAAGAPAGAREDPLEELARLVGLDGYLGNAASEPAQDAAQASQPRLPHIDDQLNDGGPFDRLLRVSFADFRPQPPGSEAERPAPPQGEALGQEREPETAPVAIDQAPERAAERAPRRSGRAKLAMGVLVGLGAAGFVAAWAVKGAPGLPRKPPVILALNSPTKVQPPTQDTVASPGDTTSDLLKDETAKPDAVKLVSNEEQPVDLHEQVPAAPAAVTRPPSAAVAATPAIGPTPSPALAEQIPDKPIAALATVGATAAPAAPPAPFPEPKRVRTISVRPDGSVISSAPPTLSADASAAAPGNADPQNAIVADTTPTASVPLPAARAEAPSPATPSAAPALSDNAAEPSGDLAMPRQADVPLPRARPSFANAAEAVAPLAATPKVDLPARPPVKTIARVPVARIETTVSNTTSQAPESPLQLVPDLLGTVAKAVGGRSVATAAPTAPANQVASTEPVATPEAVATSGDGAYAVQLAAPGTEREAQSMLSRLQTKYVSELNGVQPVIHQAEINGRPIYRVRVVGMSRREAVALCLKLKATGGDGACFVAKN